MKRSVTAFISFCILFLSSCGPAENLSKGNISDAATVNLDISVALSDVSDTLTRAGDSDAANDNEKMNTLRIVIVRPDGIVEANRLIDLRSAAVLEHDEKEPFKVVANETKTIYLFVNENTEIRSSDNNIKRKLLDFDFKTITVGHYFPVTAVDGLTIRLDNATEQLSGPLPMSAKHSVEVPGEDHSCTLFVTRAAVKFSFRITNRLGTDIKLTGLMIDKMARREWYLPRAVYDAGGAIVEYNVPLKGNDEYYTFGEDKFAVPIVLEAGKKKNLDPIYLLEGKYTDVSSGGRNYSVKLFMNGTGFSKYFPELDRLPRNTHVVVNAVIETHASIKWEVDLLPYELLPYDEEELEPGFGW